MGKFTATTVERIEWDFNDVPQREDGTSVIEHEALTGTLPEPSPKAMQKFLAEYQTTTHVAALAFHLAEGHVLTDEMDEVRGKVAEHAGVEVDALSAEHSYGYAATVQEQSLVDLGFPAALAEQLPARHLRAFYDYVANELLGEGDSSSSDGSAS